MEERINPLPIYTIGYGNRPLDEYLALLRRYNIEYIVDIRSQPYSRFHPDYSKASLENTLKRAGLHYVFLGALLGGRPTDEACYVNGKVDYALLRAKPFYQQGIARLAHARAKAICMALMCSEQKPEECHRSKLIGSTLRAQGIEVMHIDETGMLKVQAEVERILTGGQLALFDDPALNPKTSFSRKKYTPEGPKK